MKVTVDRKALADGAKAVAKFLPRSFALPSIGNIKLEAHSGIVALQATNLESGRLVEKEATVDKEGECLAPPAIVSILSQSTGPTVELRTTDTMLIVESGGSSWRLRFPGSVSDFPDMVADDAVKVPIDHWDRIRGIATVADASGSRKNNAFRCVFLEEGQAVGTDSYRLAYARVTEHEHPPVLLPALAVQALDAEVTALHISERQVRADVDDGMWWTRIVDDKFPQWREFLERPKPTVTVKADSEALAEAVRRSMPVNSDVKTARLWVRVRPHGFTLEVEEGGEVAFSEDVAAEVKGKDLDVRLNAHFWQQMLALSPTLELSFVDDMKPVFYTADWFEGLQMPISPKVK